MIPIVGYRLAWDVANHVGFVEIGLYQLQPIVFKQLNGAEFAALAAILNEAPIFWDPQKKLVVTKAEPAGGD
jgi:hypothetical protein